MKINSAIVCAAGIGSRLFPTTWVLPKELFPVGDKPALHHILEEIYLAGIENVSCIISSRKKSIIDYLSYRENQKEVFLTENEKKRLDSLENLNQLFNYNFLYQENALGVGNAIQMGEKETLEDDYVAIVYPDDIFLEKEYGLSLMINYAKSYNASFIALEEVSIDKISSYGIISSLFNINDSIYKISSIFEKPKKEDAPSNLAIIGRYVISSEIFNYFKKQKTAYPCFVTAMNDMISDGYPFYGCKLPTKRFDIGTIDGWIDTIKNYPLK